MPVTSATTATLVMGASSFEVMLASRVVGTGPVRV